MRLTGWQVASGGERMGIGHKAGENSTLSGAIAESVSLGVPGGFERAQKRSLMSRVIRGSAWTTFGYLFSQCFRLGSNIVLTRLLTREDFGIIATVNIVMAGLVMLSDIGIEASIIQSKRGDDPVYQNTAWTLQVIRGAVLWAAACGLAYPLSLLWGHELVYVLPVAATAAMIAGCQSTAIYSLNRDVRLGATTLLIVGSDVAAKVGMVAYAIVSPTIWALVFGGVLGSVIKSGVSHLIDPRVKNRFVWDAAAARELYRFGRWITISTMVTYVAGNLEKLAFGPLFGNAAFGVFWIAVMLSEVGPRLMKMLGSQVGFPALADLYRRDFDRFRYRFGHARLAMILPTHAGVLLVVLFGGPFVMWVYPAAYAAAAWILPVLALNSIAGVVNATYGNAFLATGRTVQIVKVVVAQVAAIAVATSAGYWLGGEYGFVWGFGCVQWLLYPVYAVLAVRERIWQPRIDLPAMVVTSALAIFLLTT